MLLTVLLIEFSCFGVYASLRYVHFCSNGSTLLGSEPLLVVLLCDIVLKICYVNAFSKHFMTKH
jgi:hypothetical protein